MSTFQALRHRNYRLFFFGQMISLIGTWVQAAAMAWLAYALTHESRWPALILGAQILPTCLLGPWAGTLADRYSRRALVFAFQAVLLSLSALLAVLVFAGWMTPGVLLAVAAGCGIANALDLPARLALVMDMVSREDTLNAVALNSLTFNIARAVGPVLGTWLLDYTNPGWCFALNSLTYVAVLLALSQMRFPARKEVVRHEGTSSGILAGFRYLGQRSGLVLLLILSGTVAFCGWPVLSLLPALADKELGVGEQGFGWMVSSIGGGALLAAVVVASFASLGRRMVFIGGGVLLAMSSLLFLSNAPTLVLGMVCCVALGCGLILFFATAQGVLQLSASDHNRGRVMSVWPMVLGGAVPLGNLLAGLAADFWGVRPTLACQGLIILAMTLIVGITYLLLPRQR